jgi:hypothetical protein
MGILLSLFRRFRWLGWYCSPLPLSAPFVDLPGCSSERLKALCSQGRKWAIGWSEAGARIHRRTSVGRGVGHNLGIAEIPQVNSITCALLGSWMRTNSTFRATVGPNLFVSLLYPRRPHRKFSLYCWNVFTESLHSNGSGAGSSEFIGALLVAQQRAINTRTSIDACVFTCLLSRCLAMLWPSTLQYD